MRNDSKSIKDQFGDWLAGQGIQADLVRLNLEYMDLCGTLLAERRMIQGDLYSIIEYAEINQVVDEMQEDRELRYISQKKNGYLLRVLRRYAKFLKGNSPRPADIASGSSGSGHYCEEPSREFSREQDDHQEEFNTIPEEEVAPVTEEVVPVAEQTEEVKEAVPVAEQTEEVIRNPMSMKILFGNNTQTEEAVLWCPNDTDQVFHTNMGIIGTMGTGKTQFTKSVITQLYQQRRMNFDGTDDLGILIFDYKGDYNESKPDFAEMTNTKVLKPYHLPFNPFAIVESSVFKPLLPLHTANAFKDTLTRIYGLGPKQQNTLFRCIMEAYERKGINAADPQTWRLPAPTFRNVYTVYQQNDEIDKKDSLAAAMDKLAMFELFENIPTRTTSLYDLIRGVLVIDLSGYDPDIQSLIVAITLDLFYVQMQSRGSSRMSGKYRELKKMILVDEADNFMREDFPSLKRILKEGREFGVGTILTTQFLKNFTTDENDYNKFILTWVVHNVADLRTQDVDFVFGTKARSAEEKELYDSIKKLTKHHSIVKIGNTEAQFLKDRAFWEMYRDRGN